MSQPILIPLVAAAAILAVALLAVTALVVRDPKAATRRVEALFRKPRRPAARPADDHYYKPYWS